MPHQILLDAAARSRLAYIVAQLDRPPAITATAWKDLAQGRVAAVSFDVLAALCDAVPDLLTQLQHASMEEAKREVTTI